MAKVPVSAQVLVNSVTTAVTAAAGGVGAAIPNTQNCVYCKLKNTGDGDFEYQIGAGPWVWLGRQSDTTLDINLSSNTIKTRKSYGAQDSISILDAYYISGTMEIGDDLISVNHTPVNVQSGIAYTLALTDAGGNVDMTNAAANTLTIPTNAQAPFEIGNKTWVTMAGAGITTIAGPGVTLQKPAAKSLSISAQYERAELHKVAINTWRVNAS